MIRVELNDGDLAHTRLALSPLWETVASICVLHKHEPELEYAEWIVRTRHALQGVDLGPVTDPFAGTKYVPDFLAPIPDEPTASIDDELERVRATEFDVVRLDIADAYGDDPPPPWDAFLTRPHEMLDRLADGLHAYWEAALSPTTGRGCDRCSRATCSAAPARWPCPAPRRCSRSSTPGCAGATP